MPELPEVETVRRGLAPFLEGRRISHVTLNREDLRFPFPEQFAARLTGAHVRQLKRRAKYLLAEIVTAEQEEWIWITHLGMTGRFSIEGRASSAQPGRFHNQLDGGCHRHVHIQIQDGPALVYIDPRRFGFMELYRAEALSNYRGFAKLGPEPDANLQVDMLQDRLRGKKTPIKSALLDQSVIAGLGNIYVCEALFLAGISPRRLAHNLGRQRISRLVPAIISVIDAAIRAGGSTLRDFRHGDGSLGYFQHHFSVYDRENEPCVRSGCDGTVQRLTQSGRSTFFCGRCQR